MFSHISSDNACESPTYKKATIFNLSNWLFQKESQFHAVKGFILAVKELKQLKRIP